MYNKLLKLVLVLSLAVILTNCSRMQALMKKQPKGDEFQTALAEEYKELAIDEAGEHDWKDAEVFAEKSMDSADAIDTMPEELERWDIPGERLNELRSARTSLMNVVTDDELVQKYPKVVAKAQSSFDCWVQEQEENWQKADIEKCRQDFYRAMKVLNPFLLEDPYTVYFSEDSYMVRAQGQQKLMHLAKLIKAMDHYHEVVVNGHTDSKGTDDYNMKLAKLRAISVKKLLVRYGVAPEKVTVFAFGETDPAVATEEDTDEPRNRRVEVYVHG